MKIKKIKLRLVMRPFLALFIGFSTLTQAAEVNLEHKKALAYPSVSRYAPEAVSTVEAVKESLPAGWPEQGIHVFPDAGRKAWFDAINQATKTIQMSAYKLSDPALVEAVIQVRKQKNIKVDLLIQRDVHTHEKSLNAPSPIARLKENGISVFEPSLRFNQIHYKMIIIDGKWGMISSGNLDVESFDGDETFTAEPPRDFAITITNPGMIKELSQVFAADTRDERIVPTHAQLVWGPDQQRWIFLLMINSAQKSIRIYQQDFQDVGIAQAVAGAAREGVKVEVIMMPFPFGTKEDKNIPNQQLIREAGGIVYLHNKHYIHAKLMIVDNQLMYTGSCNFYTPSLDQTRELGVLTADPQQIEQVNAIFDKDRLQVVSSSKE